MEKINEIDLYKLSEREKDKFLKEKIYKHVKHSATGKLLINTRYCRIAAKLLGGDYDELTKIQKSIFKGELVFEQLNPNVSFDRYTRY